MIPPIVIAVGRLAGLTLLGYLVFSPAKIRKHLLPVVLHLVMNVVFPLYFVFRLPSGWHSISAIPVTAPIFFFFLFLGTVTVQLVLAKWWVGRLGERGPVQPVEFVLLATFQNAGFIPLPILERIAPDTLVLSMFFYLLAFNSVFWSIAGPVVRSGSLRLSDLKFQLNPPLVGIFGGLILAVTGWYRIIPPGIWEPVSSGISVALDAALFVLGGILAGMPREHLRISRDVRLFVAGRMVVYPAVVLAVSVVLYLAIPTAFVAGLAIVLVLEATVPPATNAMVIIRAHGTDAQVAYSGNMILITYLVSAVTVPVFMLEIQSIIPGY